MGTIAAILGSIGGLCAVLGIVIVAEVELPLGEQFTWEFWFLLSAILILGSIALSLGRSGGGGYD